MLQSPGVVCFEFKSTCTRISTAKRTEFYAIKPVTVTFFIFAQAQLSLSTTRRGVNLLEGGLELLNPL